jgi:hypothetical protein
MNEVTLIFPEVSTGMAAILALGLLIIIAIIWNLQRDQDNQVDIKDLICTDGQISEAKFSRFVAFLVSTWGFVYLILDQRFSEWYFAGYMAAWTGNALFNKWLDTKLSDSHETPPRP